MVRDKVANFVNELEDDRVVYIRHEENKGANIARNTGIKFLKENTWLF
ncbi:hypothetical protein CL176_04415 [Suicoccus acidiformans]|uniref:Glycosyltransferase 2-like domain-containing protein n=1 Tax=Suicoccus acidiformans TaxID=2036206 RepID=A0A347WJP3_9LACT|nr:hypothetical protein CL176_04415 [Suicoccus acidiformans]